MPEISRFFGIVRIRFLSRERLALQDHAYLIAFMETTENHGITC
jgi:hypothetical protein